MQLLNNKSTTAAPRWTASIAKSRRPARVATMLALSLCCAALGLFTSCKTRDRILPAIHQGPQGNATVAMLPAGTVIILPESMPSTVAQSIATAFVNEAYHTQTMNGLRITLHEPLRLITGAYLAERDAREMNLHRRIAELEARP